jgi:TonB family protein
MGEYTKAWGVFVVVFGLCAGIPAHDAKAQQAEVSPEFKQTLAAYVRVGIAWSINEHCQFITGQARTDFEEQVKANTIGIGKELDGIVKDRKKATAVILYMQTEAKKYFWVNYQDCSTEALDVVHRGVAEAIAVNKSLQNSSTSAQTDISGATSDKLLRIAREHIGTGKADEAALALQALNKISFSSASNNLESANQLALAYLDTAQILLPSEPLVAGQAFAKAQSIYEATGQEETEGYIRALTGVVSSDWIGTTRKEMLERFAGVLDKSIELFGPKSGTTGEVMAARGVYIIISGIGRAGKDALKDLSEGIHLMDVAGRQATPQAIRARKHLIPLADQLNKDALVDEHLAALAFLLSEDAKKIPIIRQNPVFPRKLMRKGKGGTLLLKYTITTTGRVENIRVAEEPEEEAFAKAAIKSLKNCRFIPRVSDGKIVAAEDELRMNFKVDR